MNTWNIAVFPARAGMSRERVPLAPQAPRVPRASGDEPQSCPNNHKSSECSPRERG